jgi:hypothetical protein
MDLPKIKIVPFCKKNGHKCPGHWCVYCNRSKESIQTNNPHAKFVDVPEYGHTYALTGAPGAKCIQNGNTWAESLVK